MGENRHRHTVWMDDAVWDQVESHYQKDNCSTKNEYIEKAIQFYSGYLNSERAGDYLPRVLADVLEGKLGALGKRMGHLLFKLAVEEALMTWMTPSPTRKGCRNGGTDSEVGLYQVGKRRRTLR